MAINKILYDTSGEEIVDQNGNVTVYSIDGTANRVNKVQYGRTVLIDITDSTAEVSDVALGETFYTKDGVKRTGTKSDASPIDVDNSTGSVSGETLIISSGGGSISLQSKTATPSESTQAITPDSSYDGLSQVTVNPIPSSYIVPSGSQTITSNGTYDVTSLAEAVVNVSNGSTWATGTFTPSSATASVTFDTTLSTIHGILIVPTSETPFSFSTRTQVGMIVTPDCYYKSISLHSNSGGTGFQTPTASTSNSQLTQNGTSVTITAPYNFRTLSYTWFAW